MLQVPEARRPQLPVVVPAGELPAAGQPCAAFLPRAALLARLPNAAIPELPRPPACGPCRQAAGCQVVTWTAGYQAHLPEAPLAAMDRPELHPADQLQRPRVPHDQDAGAARARGRRRRGGGRPPGRRARPAAGGQPGPGRGARPDKSLRPGGRSCQAWFLLASCLLLGSPVLHSYRARRSLPGCPMLQLLSCRGRQPVLSAVDDNVIIIIIDLIKKKVISRRNNSFLLSLYYKYIKRRDGVCC